MAATVLTNAGRAIATGLLTGITSLLPKYIALGTGAVDPTRTSTALTTELTTGNWAGYARQIAAMSQQTVSSTNDEAKFSATFTNPGTTNPIAITELGTFDALTGGNSFILADFAAVNLNTNDSITANVTAQYT